MESRPELEFEYFLAAELHMTRARLLDEMSNDEFMGWYTYYSRKAQREEIAAKRR